MFGLLGLFGLFMAGYLAAPFSSDDAEGDEDQAPEQEDAVRAPDRGDGGDGDGTTSENTDDGMPISDDIEDEPDPDLRLIGTDGSDILNGGSGDDWLSGGEARDALAGGVGNDTLLGEEGDDDLDAGDGDDRLIGGAGMDRMAAGAGDDSLWGGAGDDQLSGGGGNDDLGGGAGNDTLLGGEGEDDLRGNAGDDWLAGGYGDDVLAGGSGNDTVDGGAGNDTLDGGTGQDYLNAGDGDDVLRLAEDTHANGGAGADVFQIGSPGTSVIADYVGGEDRLVVLYDPAEGQEEPEIAVQVDGADALILLEGQVLARVSGGAGLTLEDLQLQPI